MPDTFPIPVADLIIDEENPRLGRLPLRPIDQCCFVRSVLWDSSRADEEESDFETQQVDRALSEPPNESRCYSAAIIQ
jgi:hypothetical protein